MEESNNNNVSNLNILEILNKDKDFELSLQKLIDLILDLISKALNLKSNLNFIFYIYDSDFAKYLEFHSNFNFNSETMLNIEKLFEEGIINLIVETAKPRIIKNIYSNFPKHYLIIPINYLFLKLGVYILFLNEEKTNLESTLNPLLNNIFNSYNHYLYFLISQIKIKKKEDNLQLIINSNKRLNFNIDIESNLRYILKISIDRIIANYGAIVLFNEKTNKLFFKIISSKFFEKIIKNSWKLDNDIFSFVIKNKLSLLIHDIKKDIRFKDTFKILKPDFGSLIITPFNTKYFKGCIILLRNSDKKSFDYNDYDILQSIASNISITIENIFLYKKINDTYLQTTLALASAIEAKDPYTKGHSQRVTNFSLLIGKLLKLSREDLKIIRLASILHDVGKIGIPENIILKKGPLNDQEFNIMKRHPIIGYNIVKEIEYLKKGLPFILSHHEKIDGSGYPMGLKGDKLPLFAKIGAVADSFDAMVSDRPYRKGLSFEDAAKELKENIGKKFDKLIVETFIKGLKIKI
ncbi:MAG: HD domain-containing protein [Spirochaetes bacterium]|nr:HD domain-containing protein [Spirochaetota bacterium]